MCPNLWPRVETLRLSWVMGEVATLTELILAEKTMFWNEKGSITFFSQRKKIKKIKKRVTQPLSHQAIAYQFGTPIKTFYIHISPKVLVIVTINEEILIDSGGIVHKGTGHNGRVVCHTQLSPKHGIKQWSVLWQSTSGHVIHIQSNGQSASIAAQHAAEISPPNHFQGFTPFKTNLSPSWNLSRRS